LSVPCGSCLVASAFAGTRLSLTGLLVLPPSIEALSPIGFSLGPLPFFNPTGARFRARLFNQRFPLYCIKSLSLTGFLSIEALSPILAGLSIEALSPIGFPAHCPEWR
jgi:hypothetical protein